MWGKITKYLKAPRFKLAKDVPEIFEGVGAYLILQEAFGYRPFTEGDAINALTKKVYRHQAYNAYKAFDFLRKRGYIQDAETSRKRTY